MSGLSYSEQLNVRKSVGDPHASQLALSQEPILFCATYGLKHCAQVGFEMLIVTRHIAE